MNAEACTFDSDSSSSSLSPARFQAPPFTPMRRSGGSRAEQEITRALTSHSGSLWEVVSSKCAPRAWWQTQGRSYAYTRSAAYVQRECHYAT